MKIRKVLVTGGAGFIGSHLSDKLIQAGHSVSIIDDLSGGKKENLNRKAKFYQLDLRDHKKTDKAIKIIKPEIVFHLAANAAENKAQFSPIDITSSIWNTFINTLVPFINNGGKRFVFVSSIGVYGALQTPFKETDKPEPEDLYGVSKLSCEQALKIMAKVHGFEYVIARPHNVYGPRQNMRDPYRNVVTIWMNAMLAKLPWYIYGDGKQKRCFSYIDDLVGPLYKCGFEDVSGKIFNIGSDRGCTLNELSKNLQTITRININLKYLPARSQEVKKAVADHTQAKRYLKYRDLTDLAEGLRKTWEWCKKQGPQKPVYTRLEIDSDKVPRNWRGGCL